MALDISQLTKAASANARGVAGGQPTRPLKADATAGEPPTLPGDSRPERRQQSHRRSEPTATTPLGKRRRGTVRLSLDIDADDAREFRAFAAAKRHSQETVFRVALQLLREASRDAYLDRVDQLPPR